MPNINESIAEVSRSNDPTLELLEEIISRLNRIESKQDDQNKLVKKLESNMQLLRVEVKNHGSLLVKLLDLARSPNSPVASVSSAFVNSTTEG